MDIANNYVRRSFEQHYNSQYIPAANGLFLRSESECAMICSNPDSAAEAIDSHLQDAKNYGFQGVYFVLSPGLDPITLVLIAQHVTASAKRHGLKHLLGIKEMPGSELDAVIQTLGSLKKDIALTIERESADGLDIRLQGQSPYSSVSNFIVPTPAIWTASDGLKRTGLSKFRERFRQYLKTNTAQIKVVSGPTEITGSVDISPSIELEYFFLQDLYEIINTCDLERTEAIASSALKFRKSSDYAVCLHIHFFEAFQPILERLDARIDSLDFVITVTPNINVEQILFVSRTLPSVKIIAVENLGRDILPFLIVLKSGILDEYVACCKLHSKQSAHNSTQNGLAWRDNLYANLLRIDKFKKSIFESKADTIMWTHPENLRRIEEEFEGPNPEKIKLLLSTYPTGSTFIAGTMFWFRARELNQLLAPNLVEKDFLPEPIPVDGTWAHALERFFSLVVIANGYKIGEVP